MTAMLIKHPPPFHDEGPCGYLTRLAHLNGLEPQLVFEYAQVEPHFAFSRGRFREHIQSVCAVSHAPEAQIRSLFSFSWVRGHAHWEEGQPSFRGEMGRNAIGYGRPKICPICIAENLYWRKEWEFTIFSVCPDHGILLLDDCTKCGHPFDWKETFLDRCSECGADLCKLLPCSDPIDLSFRLSRLVRWLVREGEVAPGGMEIASLLEGLSLETLTSIVVPLVMLRTARFQRPQSDWVTSRISNTEFEQVSAWAVKLFGSQKDIMSFFSEFAKGFQGLPGPEAGLLVSRPLQAAVTSKAFNREKHIGSRLHNLFRDIMLSNPRITGPLDPTRDRIVVPSLPKEALPHDAAARYLAVSEPALKTLFCATCHSTSNPQSIPKSLPPQTVAQIRCLQQRLLDREQTQCLLGIGPDSLRSLEASGHLMPRITQSDPGFQKDLFALEDIHAFYLRIGSTFKDRKIAATKRKTDTGYEEGTRNLIAKSGLTFGEFCTAVIDSRIAIVAYNSEAQGLEQFCYLKKDLKHLRPGSQFPDGTCDVPQACRFFGEGVYSDLIRSLVKTGYLEGVPPVSGGGPHLVRIDSLKRFRKEYVFVGELANRWDISSAHLTYRLHVCGFEPVAGPRINGVIVNVFRRSDVDGANPRELAAVKVGRLGDQRRAWTPTPLGDDVMTYQQVCENLGCTANELRRLIDSKILIAEETFASEGRILHFDRDAVEAYVNVYIRNPDLMTEREMLSALGYKKFRYVEQRWTRRGKLDVVDTGISRMFRREQVLACAEEKAKLINYDELAAEVGLPSAALLKVMCKKNLIRPVAGPWVDGGGTNLFDRETTVALVRGYLEKTK